MAETKENSSSSRESEIDTLVDDLIAKILSGSANERDRIEFDELVSSRARLMRTRHRRVSHYGSVAVGR